MIKIKPETVELIEELLPFSVLLTSDKTIAGVGQTLRRRYGHVQVGGMFSDYFEILNPRASGSAIEPVEQDGPRFLMIRLREKGLRLRGSARRMGPNSILLELSPAISSEAELGKAGLSYDDLPLHDNTLDLLISLRAHRDALNQAKALTDELDTQNAAIALAHRELVDLLEQERVAAQFRNRVLGMLSHELRTSLAQVMSVGELLRRGIKTDQAEVLRKHGVTLAGAASQIVEAFEGLSRYARSEGTEEHHYEEFSLMDAIEEARLRVDRQEACEGRIQARAVHAGSQALVIQSNRGLLLMALSNLMSNALKYSKPGGRVSVEWDRCEGEVAIRVADKGIGIAPQMQQKIFDPYVRGNNVESRPGSGIGLAVVQLCLDALGGKTYVQSAVDQGTVFTIVLPIRRHPKEAN